MYLQPSQVGGTESYLRNLLKGIEQQDKDNYYYIFTNEQNHNTFSFKSKNFKRVKCKFDYKGKLSRVFYESFEFSKFVDKFELDIMFFPTYNRCISNIKNCINVSNVHDIQYLHLPQNFSKSKTIFLQFMYKISLTKSDYIICISDNAKKDIANHFKKIDSNKFYTIYNPIDFEKFNTKEYDFGLISNKYNIEKNNYLLTVGSLLPHKNIITLVKAFKILVYKYNIKEKLVLCGIKGKDTYKIKKVISKLGLDDNIVLTGFVSDNELSDLYSFAKIFVLPSLFEGFGMPIVEAMYKKIPSLTTKCTSLPEVSLHLANYVNDALDSREFARKIYRIMNKKPDLYKLEQISKSIESTYNINKIANEYIKFFQLIYKKS